MNTESRPSQADPQHLEHCGDRRADALLLEIFQALLRNERKTMSALDDIQASVATLTAAATANAQKVDSLLAAFANLSQEVAKLQAGGGATADQLTALKGQIDAAAAAVTTEDAKVDAALNPPPPPPAPAPAPAAA